MSEKIQISEEQARKMLKICIDEKMTFEVSVDEFINNKIKSLILSGFVFQYLKPCPFCGSTFIIFGDYCKNGGYSILCADCSVRTDYGFDKEAVVNSWNRRAEQNHENTN